jgi:predicted nucleotidyltransferase
MEARQSWAGSVPREVIQHMADMIAQHFHPDKVILFGSYARGQANENSDIDLMVLLEEAPPEGRRSAPMIRLLVEHFPFPVDVVVRTTSGFEQWRHVVGSLVREVAREGIVLYDKARPRSPSVA